MAQYILERVKKMSDGLGAEVDACSKSLRGYPTQCHPLFLDRIKVHYPELGSAKLKRGVTFEYTLNGVDGFKGNTTMNFLLQSFYEQETDEENDAWVIYPRVSPRTMVQDIFEETSMSDHVQMWVAGLSHEGWVSLRCLADADLGTTITDNLLNDFRNSSFSQQVIHYLMINQWSFPAHTPLVVKGRVNSRDLIMKTKYDQSRDDNRAYCVDSNRLRQLVGACLNRMIVPKSVVIKKRLHSSKIVHCVDKDILSLSIPMTTRDDYSSVLVLGDISNFTGSLGNSWFMLFCMALDTQNTLRHKYNLFGLGDTVILTSWHELIALYLYLTVHYPCYVEELNDYFTLPGGFLGVNANITTGLLCLSLTMTFICHVERQYGVEIHAQAGGDDFAFVIHGLTCKVEKAIETIRSHMTSYVGLLKEFHVVTLGGVSEGVVPDLSFCRKRIIHETARGKHFLRGEESCPIHRSILPGSESLTFEKQLKAWTEFDLNLLRYESKHPDMFRVAGSLRRAFLEKYPNIKPLRVETERICNNLKVHRVCGKLITKAALETVNNIDVRRWATYICFQTFEAKLRHALSIGSIIQRYIVYRGDKELLTLGATEEGSLRSQQLRSEVGIFIDYDFLDRKSVV